MVEEYKIDGFRWDLTKGFTQIVLQMNELYELQLQTRIELMFEIC
jgi:pullulanase/glycogen debranching enzyme